ncbi:TRAP transporter small permease [Psychrobacillus sp. OK032]|uniref:TRAP transporter small permease n=1 Tax=Psychrobacillus sp. OK032 TaxID=1884358 RepID=UPI0008B7702B|nr:TRAP transporter small permease [Psychrobacillus sp. OK032]SER69906.1 TRAP-type C4-dicarboxylate transport system, small permease component [Psychrobacillus sp. OK032]
MKTILTYLEKVNNVMKIFGLYIAGIALVGMMVMIFGDVLMRNVFDKPLIGTYEIVEYFLMPLLILPALPYTYSSGILPRLGELKEKLKPSVKTTIDYMIQSIEIFTFGLLTYYSFIFAFDGMVDGVATAIGLAFIPLWPVYFFLPFAFGFVFLEALLSTLHMILKTPGKKLYSEDASSGG